MLETILVEAAINHGFELVKSTDQTIFFSRKSGDSERYLVLKTLFSIKTVDEIHEEVISVLPQTLVIEPSFNKNCDLVLIHQLTNLSDFKKIENKVLELEENPYHFKKYFLYFSDAEERAISGKSFLDFKTVILKMDEFGDYKKNPLDPSFYSVVARTFIKLPFLEVPRSEKSLQTLSDSISASVSEENLQKTFELVSKYKNTQEDAEALVQELLNEELENIKVTNSRV
ncbi:MAG: hypothetical protein KGO49_00735 [Gammaproteobacteria bacterium]|nr:hypothetical protein [Gammaproteobacteria bacterium]